MNDLELRQIFKDVFLVSNDWEIDTANLGVLKAWDSFSHMRLFVEIEERFGIDPIDPQTISKLTSYEAISKYLRAIKQRES